MADKFFVLHAIPQRMLVALVRGYRLFLSPWLGSACRFEPTCSAYSLQALQQHGATAGVYLTLRRLARCHPLCQGGHEPVPQSAPRFFGMFPRGGAPHAPAASSSSPEKTLS